MKFAVSLEQRDYLRKHGCIPFEGLLTAAELTALNQGIEALALEAKKTAAKKEIPVRDLFRLSDPFKRVVLSKRLVELAYELTEKKPIRIAFDQLLLEKTPRSKYETAPEPFATTGSFQDFSCISRLIGLFLIRIQTRTTEQESEGIGVGDGYFILPSTPFPFDSLTPSTDQRFLLIAYCDNFSQYLLEPKDPEGHFLKSLGYVFGDKLNDRLHPILLR